MADTPQVTPQIGIPQWAMPTTPTAPSIKKIGNLSSMTTTDLVQTRMKVVRSWEKDFAGLFSHISVDAAGKFGKEFEGAAKEFVKEFERSLYETIGKGIFEQFMKNLPNMPGFEPGQREPGPSDEEEKIIKSKWGKLMDSLREKINSTFGDLKDKLSGDISEVLGPELRIVFSTLKNVIGKLYDGFKKTFGFFSGILKNKILPKLGIGGRITKAAVGAGGPAEEGSVVGDLATEAAGTWIGSKALPWLGKNVGKAAKLGGRFAGPAALVGGAAMGMWEMNKMSQEWADKSPENREKLDKYGGAESALMSLHDLTEKQGKEEKKLFDTYLGDSSSVSTSLEGILEGIGGLAKGAWEGFKNLISGPGGQKQSEAMGGMAGYAAQAAEPKERALALREVIAQKFGITKEAAAGIVGNIGVETGGKYTADIQEQGKAYNRETGEGQGGFGLFQWTGPRRKALLEYAKQTGGDYKSLETQLGFFQKEISENPQWAAMMERFKTEKSPTRASTDFLNTFEKPAERVQNAINRGKIAEDVAQGMPSLPQQAVNYAGNLASGVVNAIQSAVANPTFGKNCGEQVTANINAGLEAAGKGGPKLPESNLGVGIPNFLAKNYGVPLLTKEQITPESLKAMGPGTAIGYNRALNDPNRKWGETHAEMTAINPATGQLEIASKSAERGILWKKIDENYIKSLGYDARAANPFIASGVSPGVQIAGLEKQKAMAQGDVTQQYLDTQKAALVAAQNLPKEMATLNQQQPIVQPAVSQTNVIGGRGGGSQREQQDFFSFDDPFAAMMLMSLSVLNA